MARTGDYGGGAKVLVWVGSFAVAVGAMYGIRKWRDHATAKDGLLDKAQALRSKLVDFTNCMTGYETTVDVRSIVAFRSVEGGDSRNASDCADYATRLSSDLIEVQRVLDQPLHDESKKLGLESLDNPQHLDAFCKWYEGIGAEIERSIQGAGGNRMDPPRCDGANHTFSLVESTATGRVTTDSGLVVADTPDGQHYELHRTIDGKNWERQETPAQPTRAWSWNGAGLASASDDAGGYQVYVAENGTWQARGRFKGGALDTIATTPTGVVATWTDSASMVYLQRSIDGGRTFGAPVKVRKRDDSEINTQPRDNGNVVIQTVPANGEARFAASVVEPNAKAPRPTASITFPEPGLGTLTTCNDGETMWSVVRGRHVVVSRSGGLNWDAMPGILDSIVEPKLWCTADRLAIVDTKAQVLYTCDIGDTCHGTEFPLKNANRVAVRLDPVVELLLTSYTRDDKEATVFVYRLEDGSFKHSVVHTVDTVHRLPVVFDNGRFIPFRGAD